MKTSETVRLPSETIRGAEDDIKLRAAMYGVLFQAYADKVNILVCVSKLNAEWLKHWIKTHDAAELIDFIFQNFSLHLSKRVFYSL